MLSSRTRVLAHSPCCCQKNHQFDYFERNRQLNDITHHVSKPYFCWQLSFSQLDTPSTIMSGQTITQSCSVLYRLLFLWVALKSSSNLVSANQQGPKLFGVSPDRFVASSPLVVGVSCSDGAVLVAVHAMFAEEPLLVDADEESRTLNDGTNTTNRRLLDLPRQYRGPFRIYSVDSFGSCLVSAGWRTDGQTLAKYCRHLARDEISLFGVPCQTADHGKYLASEASVWMARSALSERVSG